MSMKKKKISGVKLGCSDNYTDNRHLHNVTASDINTAPKKERLSGKVVGIMPNEYLEDLGTNANGKPMYRIKGGLEELAQKAKNNDYAIELAKERLRVANLQLIISGLGICISLTTLLIVIFRHSV